MRPIVEAFWAVEYRDGSCVAQIDPLTKTERRYAEVDHKKAVRYWWLPIPPGLDMPGFRHNPLLKRHAVDARGSQGFVTRRVKIEVTMGKRTETDAEKVRRLLTHPPMRIECYVLGIEAGPRIEIYPDGRVIELKEPRSNGETQAVLRG